MFAKSKFLHKVGYYMEIGQVMTFFLPRNKIHFEMSILYAIL